MKKNQANLAESVLIVVAHGHRGVFGLGGVHVRENDMPDCQALGVGIREVLTNVTLGIHDDGVLGLFVADQIRGVGEATEVVLFQKQWAPFMVSDVTRKVSY
jgi:hypothetical protein